MLKILFISIIFLAGIAGCKKENSVEPFNYEKDTPAWLKEKINTMSQDKSYLGMKVFRYDWKGGYVYYFDIPTSSCAFCDIYDQDGNKISFSNEKMTQDFLNNRKNQVLIWEWKH
ncbi:MAG: hypothetical protein ACM3P0_19130 [Acidobacteriota bacterium]